MSERSGTTTLIAALAVAALIVSTGVAIVVTQHLRDQGPVVSSTRIKTSEDGDYRICFQLTRDDTVEVAVVDGSDRVVRVLAPATHLSGSEGAPDTPKAGAHCFDWDGTDSTGQPVPAGVYRMRLAFGGIDRVLIPGEHKTIAAAGPPA